MEIPEELLLPTLEELEERTNKDLATKWRLRKRPGKKERYAIKQEKDAAKLKAIAGEFKKQEQQTKPTLNGRISLSAINGNTPASAAPKPTLRAALNNRTSGRPPRLKSI